jgi:hypothetical protein
MAGAKASLSPETDVTGGILVKNDGSSLTIKEKGTDLSRRLFFVPEGFILKDAGIRFASTSVEVDGKNLEDADNVKALKRALKAGMRVEIVYYTQPARPELENVDPDNIYMKSVRAISNGEEKPTK